MEVRSTLGQGLRHQGGLRCPPTFTVPLPLGCLLLSLRWDPNAQEASELWGQGWEGTGSLLSSQAFLDKCTPWSAGASRVWGLGWTAMPPKGASPPATPAQGRDRSPPLRPHYRGELPGLAAEPDGCGGAGAGGLLGSPARIKYLLCFVWPLGEGREDCRIDPELRAKRGGSRGAGGARAGRPGASGPEHPGRGQRRGAAGRGDRSGLPRAAGRRCRRETTPPAGAALFVTPRPPPSVLPADPEPEPPATPTLTCDGPVRSGPSAEAALGRVVSASSLRGRGVGSRELDAGPDGAQVRPQSPGPPHQARPASARPFLPEVRGASVLARPGPLCL